MKTFFVGFLMLGAFMLVMTGAPLQLLHIDSVKSAHAMGKRHPRPHPGPGPGPGPSPHRVAEPTTLALLAAGGVGVGIFSFIRRRNRK